MNSPKLRGLIVGIVIVCVGIWFARLHGPPLAFRVAMAALWCGLGTVGIARSLGVLRNP
jgi:hypothetical protein